MWRALLKLTTWLGPLKPPTVLVLLDERITKLLSKLWPRKVMVLVALLPAMFGNVIRSE